MTFTERNLPKTIDTAAGQTRFWYDAAGTRVKKAGPEESVITLAGLYERRESGGKVRHVFYVEGGEGPVAQITEGAAEGTRTTEYLHRDPQGSVGAVSNQAGKVVRTLYYEPFGKRRDKDGGAFASPGGEGEIGYTGQRHDDDLGLIDMRGRVYDPAIRRFLTPDPYVPEPLFGQSYNRYSYVFNNPINLIDPSGFGPEDGRFSSVSCGDNQSCGDPVSASFSFGGPAGDPAGGSSALQVPSGAPVLSAEERRPASLPTGTSVPGGSRAGPLGQAWADPYAKDFYAQLQIDMAEHLAYANAKWDATAYERMRRTLSTNEQDEDWWKRAGVGGAPPIGYGHDAMSYSRNAGHMTGVAQVVDVAVAASTLGATMQAIRAELQLMRIDWVTVYRGTRTGAELQAYDETGHLLSDAARTAYLEGGSLAEAYASASRTHAEWVSIWGSEGTFVEAHGAFGTELSQSFHLPRTLLSVTTDPAVAARFAGPLGRVFSATVPRSALLTQTLQGAGESEMLLRFGAGGFR